MSPSRGIVGLASSAHTRIRMSTGKMISHIVERKVNRLCWWWQLSWRRWELSWALKISRRFCLLISLNGSIINPGVQSKILETILIYSFLTPNLNSQQLLYLLPPRDIQSLNTPTISTSIIPGQTTIIALKCFSGLLTGLSLFTFGPFSNSFSIKQLEWWSQWLRWFKLFKNSLLG